MVGVVEVGHRTLPHTADLIVEAWAPTREVCLEEAVHALVETFVDPSPASVTRVLPLRLAAGDDAELLVAVLEEVVYLVDVLEVVPVQVTLVACEDGGLGGCFDVAPLGDLRAVGPAPKAIARSELTMERGEGLWRCRALVDV